MESDLTLTLETLCPRVFPDIAPLSTKKPYVTWQLLGGKSLRFIDNTAADKRHSMVQINVWGSTRASTLDLARLIEDAMCAATVFTATPDGEAMGNIETDFEPPIYGTVQSFSVWSTR